MSPDPLEACVRDVLNTTAVRVMGLLDPVRVVITDYPEDKVCIAWHYMAAVMRLFVCYSLL